LTAATLGSATTYRAISPFFSAFCQQRISRLNRSLTTTAHKMLVMHFVISSVYYLAYRSTIQPGHQHYSQSISARQANLSHYAKLLICVFSKFLTFSHVIISNTYFKRTFWYSSLFLYRFRILNN
jgi:cytochrome c oxidase assembly factor CtaG